MPGISVSKICVPFGGGGIDWSSYWATRNAYFALPATGVSLMVGQEVTIYGDTLINVPIGNPLSVTYTCDIGTQVGNNLVITPVAGDIGNHSLRAVFKNGNYTIEDKTIVLTVVAAAAAGTKNVLMIGDSLMAAGNGYFDTALDTALSNCTLTFVGTLGTTTKHEGRNGYRYRYYATDNANPSPFIKAGVLDIAAYFTDNSIARPDIVYIRLGLNDMIENCVVPGQELTALEITALLDYAKLLVDGFLAYDSNLKLILAIPTLCTNTAALWNADYDEASYLQDDFISNSHKYWDAFITEFANGTYNARVDCSYEAIFLNRNNYLNGVHPNATGYAQLGTAMALKINEKINEDFITTWQTENAGSATKTIVIPCNGAGYDCVVDWNDGTYDILSGSPGNVSHEYATTGIKKVNITGTFPAIYFNDGGDKLKLLTIENWGNTVWQTMANAFMGCANLTGNYTDVPDTHVVQYFTQMFRGCTLFNSAVNFDTSEAVVFQSMFYNATHFNQTCAFDTAKAKNMYAMFFGASAFNNGGVALNFNTANVTTMALMFYLASAFNQSVASFNTVKVESFNQMFLGAGFAQSVATFNIGVATDMVNMLYATNIGTANYDATLIAWAAQVVQPNINVHFGTAKYSAGAATTARGVLTGAPNSWNITDGGQV